MTKQTFAEVEISLLFKKLKKKKRNYYSGLIKINLLYIFFLKNKNINKKKKKKKEKQ
jgi:hypothetical protein